jgi:hypothetical protein
MFCCGVRQNLSEGTVLLVEEYGIPCWRVRYSLWGSTVKLVGEYGILVWKANLSKNAGFAGNSCSMDS